MKQGKNQAGNIIRYYFNYSDNAQSFVYKHGKGTELLQHKQVEQHENLTLKPWKFIIIEETVAVNY